MIPDPFLDRVVGPYRVVAPLGADGMSVVYRAVHTRLNRPVAVKVLRRELVDGGEAADRFRREAQAVARLRHPHVIHVLDFDTVDGQPYSGSSSSSSRPGACRLRVIRRSAR